MPPQKKESAIPIDEVIVAHIHSQVDVSGAWHCTSISHSIDSLPLITKFYKIEHQLRFLCSRTS